MLIDPLNWQLASGVVVEISNIIATSVVVLRVKQSVMKEYFSKLYNFFSSFLAESQYSYLFAIYNLALFLSYS